MTISLNMGNSTQSSHFHSDHQLRFETGDGRTCIMVSGMVILDFKGIRSGGWRKEDFEISVRLPIAPAGKAFKVDNWVPIVTANSMQNENHAVDSGHAVTRFSLRIPDDKVLSGPSVVFLGEVGVRDVDQRISSLAYQATLLGAYVDVPESDVNLI